eukprot:jgi/Psemu1/300704/fgenesh1_kg.16_\
MNLVFISFLCPAEIQVIISTNTPCLGGQQAHDSELTQPTKTVTPTWMDAGPFAYCLVLRMHYKHYSSLLAYVQCWLRVPIIAAGHILDKTKTVIFPVYTSSRVFGAICYIFRFSTIEEYSKNNVNALPHKEL